ncbi:hypothetical protein [Aliiglaciecola sp. LCG003]|uniref:hypothetical protein n=1 Tax=Aliiglaciecola sp. LCG003 TaxID=3053655 RepID=UPI002573B6F6|nr:hypothetical protein [Aliiglaciecola sp. LCG003]WJG07731.1 hypothetical protein QR722_10165 [Aliiglaciecola sp. LCG003]
MSSKRGRPARQMSEDKIIQIVMDFYHNPQYFKQLFGSLDTYDEEKYFTDYLNNLHDRLSKTTGNKDRLLESFGNVNKKIESVNSSSKSKSEIQAVIDELKGRIPVVKAEDIEEFQSVISKLPDRLWKRYNSRLRQQEYKKANSDSRQIEFSYDAYMKLLHLKNLLNAKSWNELANKVFELRKHNDRN